MKTYFEHVNIHEILRDYPLAGEGLERIAIMSRDERRALQNKRFLVAVERAWQVPFYERHWRRAGLRPGAIRSLDDITFIPPYSKSDLMQSIEEHPPIGDFHGMDTGGFNQTPIVVHTTSGTTGRPQILFDDPLARELKSLIWARFYYLQGLRSDDIVQSVYGHGMVQGGHIAREVFLHFTNALFLSAGTGHETRSKRQVQLMRDYGVTMLVGFPDYLRHLASVAEEEKMDPKDFRIRLISTHLGQDSREALSQAWGGAEVFDTYGVADMGLIAGEGPERHGMHVMEDAGYLEIVDADTLRSVPDGEPGNVCLTVLYDRHIFPIIRFNTNDVSSIDLRAPVIPWTFQRIKGFLGRSDNMIKLRGINLYPHGIGAVVAAHPSVTGEFLCRVRSDAGKDTMTVLVEGRVPTSDQEALAVHLAERLSQCFGVDIQVAVVEPGGLAAMTEVESRQKPIRLVDERASKR
jgi:phenylacetate-CoA ligase